MLITGNSATGKTHLDSWLNHPTSANTKSCCARVPKKYFVGNGTYAITTIAQAEKSFVAITPCLIAPFFVGGPIGLDGEIYVDMGQCRQSCTAKKTKINRKEFEAILKANHSVDPVEVVGRFFFHGTLFSVLFLFNKYVKPKLNKLELVSFTSCTWQCNGTFRPSRAEKSRIVCQLEL